MLSHILLAIQDSAFLSSELLDWLVKLVLGGILAAVGKGLLDRHSGRTKSIEALLKDVKEERRLSGYSRQRIQKEAESALADWRRQEKVAPDTGRKLKEFPKKHDVVVAREFFRIGKDTACPSGDADSLLTPFFFHLYQDYDLPAELAAEFVKLSSKSPTSADLIRYRKYSPDEEPNVWILAPNVKIRQKGELVTLFQKVASEARSWLPGAHVVLEVYVPDDIETLGKISFLPQSVAQEASDAYQDLNHAARYVRARNLARRVFSEGCVLGKLRVPKEYRIPIEFLRTRYGEYLESLVAHLPSWNTVAISGPPGSGKTELANLLAGELQSRQHVIVLIASTPQLLKQIEIFLSYQTRDEAFRELVNTIRSSPVSSLLMPSLFLDSAEDREAFGDALYEVFHNKKYPVAVFVDDLQAYQRLNSTVVKLSLEAKDLAIRFVLVGRTIESPFQNDQVGFDFVKIACSLLSIDEAKELLSGWASLKPQQEIDDALERDWPEKKSDFSLYLLRILVKHLSILKEAPSVLYQNEIKNILSSVSETITIQRQTDSDRLSHIADILEKEDGPAELIEKVRRVFASDAETHLADPIMLFGTISWFSRFGERDYITVENLIKWGKGFGLDERSAKELLSAGLRAQIFNGDTDLASWYDPLVVDGCAALYLGNEVGRLDHAAIASMIECLNSSESIDILRLALDRSVLRKIILAVTNARPDLLDVVNKLLSNEFVARLAERPGYVNELGESLFNQGRKVSASNIEPLGLAIFKLLPLSAKLNELCWRAIEKSSPDATLALAAKAVEWRDDYEYFAEVALRNTQSYMHRIAADIAARQWGGDGGIAVCRRLVELFAGDLDERELQRIWSLWCARQEGDTLALMIDGLIKNSEDDSRQETAYGLLVAASLQEFIANRSPSERRKYSQEIQRWFDKTKMLVQSGRSLMAGSIVKWIAYSHDAELVNRESDWVIVSNGKSAVPVKPSAPAHVVEIFGKIGKAVDNTGNLLFRLPSSQELRAVPPHRLKEREIVRDRLGEGYAYSGELDVNWLVAFNGMEKGGVTKAQYASEKFVWRPSFRLT